MRIGLMRHGEASFVAPSDATRELTAKGVANSQRVWEQLETDSAVVVSSDYTRAIQTARLSEPLGFELLHTLSELRPDGQVDVVTQLIGQQDFPYLIVVAHQPLLGALLSYLVHGHTMEAYPFQTSEYVLLESEIVGPGLANIVSSVRP